MQWGNAHYICGWTWEHSALASMRTDGEEEEKKMFMAVWISHWLCPQLSSEQPCSLWYSEEYDLFFQVQKKIGNRAALHANKRIFSLPFAHLFYAATCSTTIFIIIKQHHFFFLWEAELMNSPPIHLHLPSPVPLFSSISAHPSFLSTLPPGTSLKLLICWPG